MYEIFPDFFLQESSFHIRPITLKGAERPIFIFSLLKLVHYQSYKNLPPEGSLSNGVAPDGSIQGSQSLAVLWPSSGLASANITRAATQHLVTKFTAENAMQSFSLNFFYNYDSIFRVIIRNINNNKIVFKLNFKVDNSTINVKSKQNFKYITMTLKQKVQ